MNKNTESIADLERLKFGEWSIMENGTWFRKGMNPKYGGKTTGEALKDQDQLDIIAKYGAYYYVCKDRYGFGYWIGKYVGNLENPERTYLDHLSKEDAMKLQRYFNAERDFEPIFGVDYTIQSFSLIVVFHEKHGDRHFIVHNMLELQKTALKIVLERHNESYYYFDYKKPVEPKLSIEEAAKIDSGRILEAVKQSWKDFQYENTQYKESLESQALLDKVIQNKDVAAAFQFLSSMKDGSYQDFEIIHPEEI